MSKLMSAKTKEILLGPLAKNTDHRSGIGDLFGTRCYGQIRACSSDGYFRNHYCSIW